MHLSFFKHLDLIFTMPFFLHFKGCCNDFKLVNFILNDFRLSLLKFVQTFAVPSYSIKPYYDLLKLENLTSF